MKSLTVMFSLVILMSLTCAAETVTRDDLLGKVFNNAPEDHSGLTGKLTLDKNGSFTLEGDVTKEFCSEEVKIQGKDFIIAPGYDEESQILVLKPNNQNCREVQSFITKLNEEQKKGWIDEIKDEMKDMTPEEKKIAQEEISLIESTNLIVMMCYGSLADGELLMLLDGKK